MIPFIVSSKKQNPPQHTDCPKTNSFCLPQRPEGSKKIAFKNFNFEPSSLGVISMFSDMQKTAGFVILLFI